MRREVKDLGWSAGFLEGEGWFGTTNQGRTPRLNAAQVQKEPLEKLHYLFGGRLRFEKKSSKNPKWSDLWWWELTGASAAAVMMTLYPMLSTKRRSAIEKALAIWRTASPRMPKGYGIRNPNSPFYRGMDGRWGSLKRGRVSRQGYRQEEKRDS